MSRRVMNQEDDGSLASNEGARDDLEDPESDSDLEAISSVQAPVKSFKAATEQLQRVPRVRTLTLRFSRRTREADRGLWFPRFVSALKRHEEILCIRFVKARFDKVVTHDGPQLAAGGEGGVGNDGGEGVDVRDDNWALASEDLDRLFGTVLPKHPTLSAIRFEKCVLPHRFVRLLLSGHAAAYDDGHRPKTSFEFKGTELDLPSIAAISCALHRSSIDRLRLHDTGMTSPKSRLITGGVAECDGLECLAVVEWRRSNCTWVIDEEAFAPGSISKLSLDECLWFGGDRWTGGGAAELFGQLRTNYRQTKVSFVNLSVDQTRYIAELISTYNFTLRGLHGPLHDAWVPCLRQALSNGWVAREVHVNLGPANYHLAMRTLWPWVLHDVSSYPALVYRFLRRGNVEALADQLCPASSTKRGNSGSTPLRRSQRIRNRVA